MKHRIVGLGLLAAVGLLFGALATPAPTWAHGAEGGARASDINDLLRITFWIALPIFLLVEGLILYAIIRYRRRRPDEMPEQVEGHRTLEITWTVLAFVIVGVLFLLTLRALQTGYEAEADDDNGGVPALNVHVTGYMFNWDYAYYLGDGEPTGVRTTGRLTIPTNRNVFLEITSTDVQHSFWLPDLAGKVDAIPGYTNTMWLRVNEPGFYQGNCAEYCGTLHYNMLIELEAVPPDDFDMWLAERQATAGAFEPIGDDLETPLPAGDAARGAEIFTQLGCDNCHRDQPSAGPPLPEMNDFAGERVEGQSAEDYLRESILVPCAYEVPGYNCQVMPHNYGESLDAQGLADLIEYLLQQ